MRRWHFVLVLSLCVFVACGKVAQDITSQSTKSVFKSATFSVTLPIDNAPAWDQIISTQNITSVVAYLEGIKFENGREKIGWVSADIEHKVVASKNVYVVTNYDTKRNTVQSARYQQGLISYSKETTVNVALTSKFKKIRPKYDYYSVAHFITKDDYLLYVTETLSSANMDITPYRHLTSLLFLKHLDIESYNRETIIPFSAFETIIPTYSVTPTLNIYPKNAIRSFHYDRPIFSIKDPMLDALLGVVTTTYHSDKVDAIDYIEAQKETVFSSDLKGHLIKSVTAFFPESDSEKSTKSTKILDVSKVSTGNSSVVTKNATSTSN
jgi:hypothetical protein